MQEKAIPSITTDDLMTRLLREKEVAFNFRERRHQEWNDNYELNRNKIKVNRLTQRQAIGIPLMKETNKTILSKIDEPPDIEFKELGGDDEKEMYCQELWNSDTDTANLEGVDIQDKKTVLLYGRGFIKLNYVDKMFKFDALDVFNVLIDPWVNPLDIESARFLIQTNIFKSLREVLSSSRYSSKAKAHLKTYMNSAEAIIQSSENIEMLKEQNERMVDMGVNESDFNTFAAGDTILNLTEHYFNMWDEKKKKYVRYVAVYANDVVRLLTQPVEDMIGVDFLPFTTWGEDIETNDFWSDGPSDIVRNINKVLNVWFSQLVENRTLKNFQMHWFDSTSKYIPQTYEPGAGKMLPAPPGNVNETIKPVEISGLDDTIGAIDFLIKLVEKGTGATSLEKGVSEGGQITLGEVELMAGKSIEKMVSMAKFYRRSRKELAWKWYKIREANTADNEEITLYKSSSKGKLIGKKVMGRDWKSKFGYKTIAKSTSEQESEKMRGVQKWQFIKSAFPDNPIVQKIAQRRILEIGDLTPDELREIKDFEEKKGEMAVQAPMQPQPNNDNQLAQELQQGVGELASLTA